MRDHVLEVELLDQACEPIIEGGLQFRRLVQERLSLGDERYGTSFLTRDNLLEALEEPCDAAAYGILHLHAWRERLSDDEFQELKMLIVGMIHAAAQADLATRRAIVFMREINPRSL